MNAVEVNDGVGGATTFNMDDTATVHWRVGTGANDNTLAPGTQKTIGVKGNSTLSFYRILNSPECRAGCAVKQV